MPVKAKCIYGIEPQGGRDLSWFYARFSSRWRIYRIQSFAVKVVINRCLYAVCIKQDNTAKWRQSNLMYYSQWCTQRPVVTVDVLVD